MPAAGNELSGTVYGTAVQAHVIHGGVTIQHVEPARGPWSVVPRQVPPGGAEFVDRDDVMAALDRWLRPAGESDVAVRVGVLSGMPGVGKSAIVRRWVAGVRELFPGGDFYVDLADTRRREHGADVSGVLRGWLRALGHGEHFLPDGLDELAALFRSVTAERRTLVVTENVSDPAQVRALVPGAPGSAVLVSSQLRLGELGGERLVSLRPLDAEYGLELLGRLCGVERVRAERGAAERLVELCGGLPVALHVAAARLATYERLTLPGLVAELSDERGRLAGLSVRGKGLVVVVFNVAYQGLPPDAARLYRRLGLSPTPRFDARTAAAVGGVDEATAQRLLDELSAASLLTPEGEGEDISFRFHELLRLHARERAEEEESEAERAAVLRRLTDSWLARVAVAELVVMGEDRLRIRDHTLRLADVQERDNEEKAAALAWLVGVRGDALAVLRAAAGAGLHRQVWQLAEALTALYLNHRYLADWRESGELGAEAAARDGAGGNPAAEARLRSLVSRPLMDLGLLEEARDQLRRAEACAAAAGHAVLSASVAEFSGRYWDRADPARAIEAYRRSHELNVVAGEERGAAIARYFLGCALDASGDHSGALAELGEAYERLAARGDARMAGRARLAIGVAREHLGEVAEARRALAEAADALGGQGATHYEAQALERLAALEERAGDGEAFRAHLGRAVVIHEEAGSPRAGELRRWLEAGPAG